MIGGFSTFEIFILILSFCIAMFLIYMFMKLAGYGPQGREMSRMVSRLVGFFSLVLTIAIAAGILWILEYWFGISSL